MARVAVFGDTRDSQRPAAAAGPRAAAYEDLFQLAAAHGLAVSMDGTPDAEIRDRLREAGVDPLPLDRMGLVAAAEAAGVPHFAAGDTHSDLVAKLRAHYSAHPGVEVAFVAVIYLC